MLTRVLYIVAAIVVLMWIFNNPTQAGTDVHNMISSLVTFLSRIGSKS